MTDTDNSVRSIFFESRADAVTALGAAVRSGAAADRVRGALGRMPEAGKNAVLAEVGEVAAAIMDLDVTDIFGLAWAKHAALRRAAATSLANPDAEELVELVTHSMSFEQQPSVEIHVADLPVATVRLRVQLEILIQGLLAVVKAGRLTAVRAGSGEVTGTLSIEDQQVAQRRLTLNLPRTIRLRDGIALLADSAAPTR